MARGLIIGCGCRGRELAAELVGRGHVVRGTTRRPERLPEIEASGAEGVVADPDRLATLVPAFDHVSFLMILLGSATGDGLAALHGPRLEAMLTKLLDTTIRGVVYEAAGSVPQAALAEGSDTVTRLCSASRIPWALLRSDPASPDWLGDALGAVDRVLDPPPG